VIVRLQLLLEHPGEVVSREELLRRLWPDQTHVDFDHCLNTAINKLRETLGDSADTPRFIQTIPRLGYRWLAPVVHTGFGLATDTAAAAPTASPKRGRLPKAWLLYAALTLALPVALSSPLWRPRPGPGAAPITLLLTSFGGTETTPAFSPEGKEVTFSWNGERA